MAGEAADAGLRPEQMGGIFPSLDGSEPGRDDAGQDISGQVLPPLTPDAGDMPDSDASGTGLSSVPGSGAQVEGAGAPDPVTVAGGEINAPQGRRAKTAADRIATLTKRYRQEQELRSGAEDRLNEALSLLRQQGEQIAALRSGRAPAQTKPANEAADALGLAGSPDQSAQPVTLDAVRGVIREVITDYDRTQRESNARAQALSDAHIAAFKEAVADFPELGNDASHARQIFNELYAHSPLRALPDGPYQIAQQIFGIIPSEVRRGQAASPQRKQQVGVVVPQSGSADPNQALAAAKQEFSKLSAQMRVQGSGQDFKAYRRWRELRSFIGQSQRR